MQTEIVRPTPERAALADRLISLPAAAPRIFRAMLWIVFGGAAAEMVLQAMKTETADWFAGTGWGRGVVPTATKCR
jgi:hypothetical protein